jgi:hypothetical protein
MMHRLVPLEERDVEEIEIKRFRRPQARVRRRAMQCDLPRAARRNGGGKGRADLVAILVDDLADDGGDGPGSASVMSAAMVPSARASTLTWPMASAGSASSQTGR